MNTDNFAQTAVDKNLKTIQYFTAWRLKYDILVNDSCKLGETSVASSTLQSRVKL